MKKLIDAVRELNADQSWRRFQVDYPADSEGLFAIGIYHIDKANQKRLDTIRDEGMARDPGWGTFRKLIEVMPPDGKGRLWMSDTAAEIKEHYEFFDAIKSSGAKRLLINGLGLGVAVKGALTFGSVEHIDVVEINPDVAKLIGRHLQDERVTVHTGDAYTIRWPRGTTWDLAWHDIWPFISDDNLPEMDRLMRKYQDRVSWQGCWQREGSEMMARQFKRLKDGTLSMEEAQDMLNGRWHA